MEIDREMPIDKVKELLTKRHGFQPDELKVLFKTDEDLRDALEESEKLLTAKSDRAGDADWAVEEGSALTPEELSTVEAFEKEVVAAKQAAKVTGQQHHIQQTGAKLTPADIDAALDALNEPTTEEPPAEKPKATNLKLKPKPKGKKG